jgi:hypothetical protein
MAKMTQCPACNGHRGAWMVGITPRSETFVPCSRCGGTGEIAASRPKNLTRSQKELLSRLDREEQGMAIADLLSEGVSTKHAGRLFERKLISGDAEDIRKCWRLRITEAGRRALAPSRTRES